MLYLDLLFTFFKIGLFTIGGGYAMIPLLQNELLSKGWATLDEIINFIAISESTPGPFAVNMATFVGVKMGGVLGAISTTLGVILPSLIIILIIAKYFDNFKDNFYAKSALSGLRPAVIGLLCSSVFTIFVNNFILDSHLLLSINTFLSAIDIRGLIILIAAYFTYNKFKIHPIKLVVICSVLGMIAYSI
ncbi:chromate transporter [Sedimentibacter sp. zth1]|nr:chromate transporter [Sedimentibacter sp. zth1]